MRWLLGLMAAAVWAQAPPAPAGLAVKSATSKQVQLTWTASAGARSYVVQRKADGDFSSVLTATAAAATDESFDPYATYTYRVLAVNDSGQSPASNEVIVGPPPYGFNVVVPGPKVDGQTRVGTGLRLILDASGDPMMAYILEDPNDDGDTSDSTLWFISWNRALYKWNAPVQVAKIGVFHGSGATNPISLARDASTGALAIAWEHHDADYGYVEFSLSGDGGLTWKTQNVAKAESEPFSEPSVALAPDKVFLAYSIHNEGIRYLSGKPSDEPSKWKSQKAPVPGGYTRPLEFLSLAADSAGNPGLAFIVESESDSAEAFWRPESAASGVIAARNNGQNDCSDISLSFSGTEPRIAFAGARDNQYNSDYDHSIWAIRASGDGGNWLAPVAMPADGEHDMSGPLASASGPHGQLAIGITDTGGIIGTAKYGYPKLSRSDDLLVFQTAGPALADKPAYGNVAYPAVQWGGNDRLWVGFSSSDIYGEIAPGLVLWREK
jgi:hypothetical protein